ncbi:hypothetical protein ACJJTC_008835 [Scirpophaga incertulas]
MLEKVHIEHRVNILKLRAAQRYNISPEKCHVGHLVLQGLLDTPKILNQIDVATETSETNESVAVRTMRLASALRNTEMIVGDTIVLMAPNHLDLVIPYYASHYNGYTICGLDPNIGQSDVNDVFQNVTPKITFCQRSSMELVKQAYSNAKIDGKIVAFDDKENNLDCFIKEYHGTEINFRPAEFNQYERTAWLIMTSGTTGKPKCAVIPYDRVTNAVISWWRRATLPVTMVLSMSSIQWLSALLTIIATPLNRLTRLQFSTPITPQLIIYTVNKYKPSMTVWTPFVLAQFLTGIANHCDLNCFKYITVTGSSMDKEIYNLFVARCKPTSLYMVYSMSELLVPAFEYTPLETPFGSVGKPCPEFSYKLIDRSGNLVDKPYKKGELWVKGDAFFKEYFHKPDETREMITEDGWVKTGDVFYKDEDNNYYFYERIKVVMRYLGFWISPLELEAVIKQHPGVADACVVAIPHSTTMELPVAAIVKKMGHEVDPKEIFGLMKEKLPENKFLHGGLFFMDKLPMTPSTKIHRSKLKEIALTADRIMPTK